MPPRGVPGYHKRMHIPYHSRAYFGHPDQPRVRADHQHDVVRATPAQPVQRGLEIPKHGLRLTSTKRMLACSPLVPGEIDKADHLRRTLADLLPAHLLPLRNRRSMVRRVERMRRRDDRLAIRGETEDLSSQHYSHRVTAYLSTDGTRPSSLDLMRVAEERDSSLA